ncbi:MAG: hypothetical protein H6R19_1468 [Proteobacteria bacterium]|nr:hypothetical protein [Pseudomonadota bacterium]
MPSSLLPRTRQLLSVCTLLLAACAPQAPKPENVVQPNQRNTGYESAQFHAVQTSHGVFDAGPERLALALRSPESPGSYPLIIHLPGLGETIDSASGLLEHWAQAGYVVLSVQSTQDGPSVLGGAQAREGGLRGIAIAAHAPERLHQRLDNLDRLLRNLRQPDAQSGLPREALGRIDFNRMLLAGLDIGAQAAQAAGGEHGSGSGWVRPASFRSLRGLILLSPHADTGGEPFATRYRDMNLPVLAVTSPEDVDGFDFVTLPEIRKQVFRNMPAGQKFLLELSSASHAVIGGGSGRGAGFMDIPGNRDNTRERRASGPPPDAGGPGGRESGGAPSGGMSKGGGGMPPGGRNMGGAPANSPSGTPSQPDSQDDQTLSLYATSLAFIDLALREDDIAQQWLRRDAKRWLGISGKLYAR